MTEINKINNENTNITIKRDFQKYRKPIFCSCCNTTIHSFSLDEHHQTEFHKIAQYIRNNTNEHIEDIKQKVIEHKMIKKYINKTFNNDSSSSSSDQYEDEGINLIIDQNKSMIDEKIIKEIKRKSKLIKKEYAHRAERYEKTKCISMIVNTIKNTTKRLTDFQIERYNCLLKKYPDNELLHSVKHLIPQQNVKVN